MNMTEGVCVVNLKVSRALLVAFYMLAEMKVK